jgi:hypothetical protein
VPELLLQLLFELREAAVEVGDQLLVHARTLRARDNRVNCLTTGTLA